MSLRWSYLLLCLPSPQDYYEMPEQDSIHLLNVASSSKQASRAFFTPMRRAVNRRGCWFQREGAEDVEGGTADTVLDAIRYPRNIEAISGHSDAESQEGLNLMGGVADEIDAFKRREELQRHNPRAERDSTRSAEGIVEMLRSSGRTRFPQVFKNVYISYPRYLGSMIQTLRRRAEEDNAVKGENSAHYVSGPHATWVVNPRVRGKEDFQDDYDEDALFAAAKYECKPARAMNPYFSNEAALKACQRNVVQDPVTVSYVREGSAWRPLYEFSPDFRPIRGAQYAMHADLAVNGCRAGIALAHVKSWDDYQVEGPADSTGAVSTVSERRPTVKVDFVLGYEADKSTSPPREIQIRWARNLCLELRRQGFNIRRFSADQFQSTDTLQLLEMQYGMETERVSTDVNDLVWKTLRDVAYEGRLELPRGPVVREVPAGPPVSPGERAVWELLALTRLPNGKVDHPPGGCFVGATRVPLLDGREVQIQELADGQPVWVYGSDARGQFVPALAIGRRTKQVRHVCDVVLDTGAVVRCTPEHLWRLRDGTYKEAQHLTSADRLLPLNRRWDFNSGYEQVWTLDGRETRPCWTHVLVREYLDGYPLAVGEVSHHDNEVKRDNRPENLVRMARGAHTAHHMRKMHAENPAYVASLRAAQRAYWSSPEARAQQAEVARRSQTGRPKAELQQRHLDRLALLRSALDARSVGAAARRVGLHRNSAIAVLARFGFADWDDFKARDGENHKIRFVELVELDEPVWVYDLEVDACHNFALTAGVFVHNSKDLADGVGGAVDGALKLGGQEDPSGDRSYLGSGEYVEALPEGGMDGLPLGFAELGLGKLRPDEVARHEVLLDGMGLPMAPVWLEEGEEVTHSG